MFTTHVRPKIPKELAMHIASFHTFKGMFQALRTAKASPDLVAALNMRVSGGIHVPRDFDTLQEAVSFFEEFPDDSKPISLPEIRLDGDAEHKENDDPNIVTIPRKIIVGEGEHQIDGDYLWIHTTVSIVGDPKEKRGDIDVIGGIKFDKGIQGNCHLQHLSLRQMMENGVEGRSSFTMDDVLVEQCNGCGVRAYGTGVVGRLTNVEIRQCGEDGVVANRSAITLNDVEVHHCGLDGVRAIRGTITLTGKTKVHHNCTVRGYGLHVCTDDATIQLVFPLTKEHVKINTMVWWCAQVVL